MSERIAPQEFVELLHEAFDRGQELIFTPSGTSMLPMLDGREDKVTFSPKSGRLRKYDVAFYRRSATGQLVLHRVVGFTRDGGYLFCGDNQCSLERGVSDDDILAVMTSFTHKGREYAATSPRYRIYSRYIVLRKGLRRFMLRIYRRIKRSYTNP